MAVAQPPYYGVDFATSTFYSTNELYWSTDTSVWGQNPAGPGRWYVGPAVAALYQEPELTPLELARVHLARVRTYDVVPVPRAPRHLAPRRTIAPRTLSARRQPVSQAMRHVRCTRRRG